jgi:GTPase Era involved in 16S rRNA processing
MALDDELLINELRERSEKVKSEIDQRKRTKVRVALIGESGAGKSSLVNAIVGRKVAKTGGTGETTQEAQEIPHQDIDGLVFYDLPGCGTPNHPRDTYMEKQALLQNFDVFILVTDKRIREGDQWLYQKLYKENNKDVFVVRTHFDNVVDELPELEARQKIVDDIRCQLNDSELNPYIVALKGREKYDLAKLIRAIIECLPGLKKEVAILAFASYGDEEILKKNARPLRRSFGNMH